VSTAPAVAAVGPMHAAAFGTSLALAADTDSSTDIYARLPPVSNSYRSSRMSQKGPFLQQQQQQQQHYRLRPYQAFNPASRNVDSERQPLLPKPQSLNATAACPAAMQRQDPSAAAVVGRSAAAAAAVTEADMRLLAVNGAAAGMLVEPTPTSCLSPLHWHQSNLGSSRDQFHQAMVSWEDADPRIGTTL
jgi:hypothetical protein